VPEDGAPHDLGHALVALERRHPRRVVAARPGPHLGHQVGDRPLLHAQLAEPGEDVGDEGEVGGARADHQHAVALQPPAMLVQQIGDAVQADRCLAGPGSALDDDGLLQRRADQVVLLRLDGGDDVAHGADTGSLDLGGQQPVRQVPVAAAEVELFVLQRGERAGLVAEAPAQAHAEALPWCGAVEGPRQARAPVDHHRVALAVDHVAAAEVEARAGQLSGVVVVDAAEEQRAVAVVGERGDPLLQAP
jgi:hypothetical protein